LTHGDGGEGEAGEQVKPAKEEEKKKKRTRVEGEEEEDDDDDDEEMRRVMGFSGFDTTRGKHVDGNDAGAVSKHKARKYRQYMNRKGGFNRPLDKID
jgi:U4/U6.U5 tri-snRNP-associated protein 3